MPRPFTDDERARIRRRLLDAARAALAGGGFRRVPVERLVAAAGISKGAFYLFFPSKEAMVVELLHEAETALREGLLARARSGPREHRLRSVLVLLFESVALHPLLHVLGDTEEMAWLERALPEGHLAAARADDDAFFGVLWSELHAQGLVGGEGHAPAFAGLPAAAFAVAHHRRLVGEERYDAVVALIVDGLVVRLSGGAGP